MESVSCRPCPDIHTCPGEASGAVLPINGTSGRATTPCGPRSMPLARSSLKRRDGVIPQVTAKIDGRAKAYRAGCERYTHHHGGGYG